MPARDNNPATKQVSGPRLFQIGFNFCAADFANELFSKNGYEVASWEGGELAREIFYAKSASWKPFIGRSRTTLFSNLECVHDPSAPMLEGFKHFAYLSKVFPDALFLLDRRNLEDWLAARAAHQDGRYLSYFASYYGLTEQGVLDRWAEDWSRHYERCDAFFGNSARLIRFDLEHEGSVDLIDKLSAWYRLIDAPRDAYLPQGRTVPPQTQIAPANTSRVPSAGGRTYSRFINELTEFASGSSHSPRTSYPPLNVSTEFGVWNGGTSLERKDGARFRLARWKIGPRAEAALLPTSYSSKYRRTQGVINDFLRVGKSPCVAIDMQDARTGSIGAEGIRGQSQLVTYNRKSGATGVVLWPLPGYHAIGNPQFFQSTDPDPYAFEDKLDVVAWRGNLTGPAKEELAPHLSVRRPSHSILSDVMLGGARLQSALPELEAVSRYAFVKRFAGSRGFDVGFVFSQRLQALKRISLFSHLAKSFEEPEFFYRHRYLVCLSGHDGPSNFPLAMASNSTVFKEDDGWEFYFSGLFRPWEHFIPIVAGGLDIEEKLDWARSNQRQCMEMVRSRHEACRLLGMTRLRLRFIATLSEAFSIR
ncbi:MAG: glycosyl transferase family 90 [Pseudomonadota bacterium]|nr:glycosyl transferase family 90 [Pseudomonadota bacterium]